MPSKTTKQKKNPGYLLHKPTGQAYVRIRGRCIYLGTYNTPESHQRYAEIISDYLGGEIPVAPMALRTARKLTVGELADLYLTHVEDRFGPTSKNTHAARYAMVALVEQHATIRADQFGPKALKKVQSNIAKQGYARSEVNRRVNTIRRAFRWSLGEELLPASIVESHKAVSGLNAGEAPDNPPRTAADPLLVRATVKHLRERGSFGAADVIEFIRWTGCRPSEGCRLLLGDCRLHSAIPAVHLGTHKTMHKTGTSRLIPLNAPAMTVIERVLARIGTLDPSTCLFPSTRGKPYTANGLYQVVQKACRRQGIERWSPYQLRHLAATEALRATGSEVATAAMLGHSPNSTIVRRYSQDRMALAADAANALGDLAS